MDSLKICMLIGRGRCEVRLAYWKGAKIALKLSSQLEMIEELIYEKDVYLKLERLQGDVIPRMLFYGPVDSRHYGIGFEPLKPLHEVKWTNEYSSRMIDICRMIHRYGYLHRDLKPENIMFNSKNEPVLIDFGCSMKCCDPVLFEEEEQEMEGVNWSMENMYGR